MEVENYYLAFILVIVSDKNHHNLKVVGESMMRNKIFVRFFHKILINYHGKYRSLANNTLIK